MNSRNPSGVHRSPSGVLPEYVEECKVLPVGHVVVWAITVVDVHRVNSGDVEYHEPWRPRCGTWAWTSSVSQLNTKAKVSETILFEKLASPTLKTES